MSLYFPLNAEENEIRLFQLHRGATGEPLKGSLFKVALHLHYDYEWKEWLEDFEDYAPTPEKTECKTHHPPYEALSYQWGEESESPPTVEINGILKAITPNLHSALRHIRKQLEERTLWVDAICINQVDDDEKNIQVQGMAAIYQQAERVLVWLGDPSPDSDLAISTLKQLGGDERNFSVLNARGVIWAGPHFHRFSGNWPYEYRKELIQERFPDVAGAVPTWLETLWAENDGAARQQGLIGTSELSEAQWDALEHFFSTSRPWWTRIWIIQEVAFAREVVFHCGSSTLLWDTLHDLWRQKSCIRSYRLLKTMQTLQILDRVRARIRDPHRALGFESIDHSLLCLITRFWRWNSTDPRDKVYALLGLARGLASGLVYPRYGNSLPDVFCEVAAAIIEEDQNLDVLCQVHRLENESIDPEWPSWVPNWSRHPKVNPLVDIQNGIRPYDASGPWTASSSLIAPDTAGNLRGGWIAARSTIPPQGTVLSGLVRRPLQSAPPAAAAQPRVLCKPPCNFYAKACDSRRLEVLGALWDHIGILLGPIPRDQIVANHYRGILNQWYTLVADLPPTGQSTASHTLATALLESSRGSHTSITELQFYHGFVLLSTLLGGQFRYPRYAATDPDLQLRCTRCWVMRFLAWIEYIDDEDVGHNPMPDFSIDFHSLLFPRLYGWKFAMTEGLQYGFVPSGTQVGDSVAIIFGSELGPNSGAYLNEANVLEPAWQWSFFGSNYGRLLAIKKK
ncbi:hypothetical protein DL765_004502 [Monosporascus sp. GIB2]|nr:hypothetical protein DL765_004502 [Monosporascus sp. GIB2]